MTKNETLKEIGKYSIYTLALAGGVALCSRAMNEKYKSPDFENAKWIEAPGVLPYNAYMGEKMNHNQLTQIDYYEAVKAKNNGNLESAILFPDLDNNGKIGRE